MFGSWRVNSSGNDPTFLRDSPKIHKACNNCRKRKVRCTGQLSGCERCEALDVKCTYFAEKAKRQRNLSEDGVNKHGQQERQQRQSWLPEGVEKLAVDVTPLSDANFYNGIEDDSAFSADIEPWSGMFPELTPDGASTLDTQSGSATSGSVYVSTRPTSHGGTGTDAAFWNDSRFPSADIPGESIPSVSGVHHTTSQQQHYNQHNSPANIQPYAQAHDQVLSQGETQAPVHMQEPEEPARCLEQMGCKCMKSIVYLINELETTLNNDSCVNDMLDIESGLFLQKTHGLDSALGLHKDAIRYGESMRQCQQCVTRAENRMLLLLLANRLVALCAHMISVYRSLTSGAHACGLTIAISVGEYEVESAAESSAVLRELLAFQLRSLHTFVTPLSSTNQFQTAEFYAVKERAASLWRGLQHNAVLLPP